MTRPPEIPQGTSDHRRARLATLHAGQAATAASLPKGRLPSLVDTLAGLPSQPEPTAPDPDAIRSMLIYVGALALFTLLSLSGLVVRSLPGEYTATGGTHALSEESAKGARSKVATNDKPASDEPATDEPATDEPDNDARPIPVEGPKLCATQAGSWRIIADVAVAPDRASRLRRDLLALHLNPDCEARITALGAFDPRDTFFALNAIDRVSVTTKLEGLTASQEPHGRLTFTLAAGTSAARHYSLALSFPSPTELRGLWQAGDDSSREIQGALFGSRVSDELGDLPTRLSDLRKRSDRTSTQLAIESLRHLDYASAISRFERALKQDARDTIAETFLEKARDAQRVAGAKPRPPQPSVARAKAHPRAAPHEPTSSQRARASKLRKRGLKAYAAGNYKVAARYLERSLKLEPDNRLARSYLARAKAR